MAAQAKMLGVWMNVNNPNRSTNDVVNSTVGGTILLNAEAVRLASECLDAHHDQGHGQRQFRGRSAAHRQLVPARCSRHITALLPHRRHRAGGQLNDREPFWKSRAEVCCRVSAKGGNAQTSATNSQIESVAID